MGNSWISPGDVYPLLMILDGSLENTFQHTALILMSHRKTERRWFQSHMMIQAGSVCWTAMLSQAGFISIVPRLHNLLQDYLLNHVRIVYLNNISVETADSSDVCESGVRIYRISNDCSAQFPSGRTIFLAGGKPGGGVLHTHVVPTRQEHHALPGSL